MHAVLDRHGLVSRAHERARASRATDTPLVPAVAPDDLWCTAFKGELELSNSRCCCPLTVTDRASRHLLLAEALASTREPPVIEAFVRLFKERGLPAASRSDNGVPFASRNGLCNLSKLAVWWLRPGIGREHIEPGHPQENGRHERMHRTLKQPTTRPPGTNALRQQTRFDAFVSEFDTKRPHGALAMKVPAELHVPGAVHRDGLERAMGIEPTTFSLGS